MPREISDTSALPAVAVGSATVGVKWYVKWCGVVHFAVNWVSAPSAFFGVDKISPNGTHGILALQPETQNWPPGG